MKNLFKHILAIGLLLLIATGNMFAQKSKQKTTRIGVEYFKDYNKAETLVATLRVKEKRYLPLNDAIVKFYCINDTSRVFLKKIRTNEKGKAIFILDDNPKITSDSTGFISFEVEYDGNPSLKAANKKIAVKQAGLEVSFFQKDTTKFIEIEAKSANPDTQPSPVKGLKVLLYVKGTFSLYNFAKEKTDKNGKIKVEFPVYMPGDTSGELTIVAKIEEDDVYGSVESRGDINWGIPVPLIKEKKRGLGDTDAPLWMVYTLITLLSAVWFHYLYVIFMIIKIKLAKT